jgi:phage terminase large subunit-like protein
MIDISHLSPAQRREAAAIVRELERRRDRNRLAGYEPYPKQAEFHNLIARERMLMAANQVGKSYSGCAEVAIHLTGRYPDWWKGKRFKSRIRVWQGSKTGEVTRDGLQRLMVGEPKDESQWGTGLIPGDALIGWSRRQGIADALDNVTVKHVSGGTSTLGFKSYDQGRQKWQGETLDLVHFDEEPPFDVYMEGLTRTNATGGIAMLTFTPLLGMSEVVHTFLSSESLNKRYISMTIDDALHFTEEQRQAIIDSYPPHEREARVMGRPSMGSGLIYPVTDEQLLCDPFQIPSHWPQIIGIDFGWDHPFSACRMAWDRDNDTIYVTAEYQERQATPIMHAASIKPWGSWIPIAWPHDGLNAEKGSGEPLMAQYKAQGLAMLHEKATHATGGNSVEAGVSEILTRMETGRFKVFSTCTKLLEERRLYHREKGKIVKERDDLLDAMRYGVMMLRYAKTKPRTGSIDLRPMGIA